MNHCPGRCRIQVGVTHGHNLYTPPGPKLSQWVTHQAYRDRVNISDKELQRIISPPVPKPAWRVVVAALVGLIALVFPFCAALIVGLDLTFWPLFGLICLGAVLSWGAYSAVLGDMPK